MNDGASDVRHQAAADARVVDDRLLVVHPVRARDDRAGRVHLDALREAVRGEAGALGIADPGHAGEVDLRPRGRRGREGRGGRESEGDAEEGFQDLHGLLVLPQNVALRVRLGRIANVWYVALKLSLLVVIDRSWNQMKRLETWNWKCSVMEMPAPIVPPVRFASGRNGPVSASGCGVWS